MSSAGNLIDFDGVGPIMGPIQLSSQLSCMCCILIFIKMLLDTPTKTFPVYFMLACCLCSSCSSSAVLVDDTMNRLNSDNYNQE